MGDDVEETKNCAHCGVAFSLLPNGDIWYFRKKKRFCSARCAAIATNKQRRPLADRFWEKVKKSDDPDACWQWIAGHATWGYGVIGIEARTSTTAHRVSYTLHFGEIPDGIEVCHRCDNPECVNPRHLFLGTHADNMKDMANKGRLRVPGLAGSRHPAAKLTEGDVRAIRAISEPHTVTAKRYGVTPETIGYIRNKQTWRHI